MWAMPKVGRFGHKRDMTLSFPLDLVLSYFLDPKMKSKRNWKTYFRIQYVKTFKCIENEECEPPSELWRENLSCSTIMQCDLVKKKIIQKTFDIKQYIFTDQWKEILQIVYQRTLNLCTDYFFQYVGLLQTSATKFKYQIVD